MNLISAKLSSGTIVSIIFTCLILAVLLAFFIVWILWKKNKIDGKLDVFMQKTMSFFSGSARQAKSKLVTNTSKGELALYWIVLASGLLSAIFLFAYEIQAGFYTMGFLRSLFFVGLLVFMITFNSRYAAIEPYYYDLNPMLFVYSGVSLFFAVLDFFMGLGSLVSFGVGLPMFIGNLMFFGTIFVTRYAKKEFKPRDIFVYVGAVIIIIIDIVSFAIASFLNPLFVVWNVVSLIYNVAIMVLLTFFYDGFAFVKNLLSK